MWNDTNSYVKGLLAVVMIAGCAENARPQSDTVTSARTSQRTVFVGDYEFPYPVEENTKFMFEDANTCLERVDHVRFGEIVNRYRKGRVSDGYLRTITIISTGVSHGFINIDRIDVLPRELRWERSSNEAILDAVFGVSDEPPAVSGRLYYYEIKPGDIEVLLFNRSMIDVGPIIIDRGNTNQTCYFIEIADDDGSRKMMRFSDFVDHDDRRTSDQILSSGLLVSDLILIVQEYLQVGLSQSNTDQ